MAASAVPRFTHEEFLDREAQSPFRHEYTRGHVEMMAGGTENHALLNVAIATLVKTALRGRDCKIYGSDMLVRMESADMSSYPDAMVICGKTHFAEGGKRVVDNPLLLVEVLSPSTASYDRGEKFAAYKQLQSLREVLFISQDRPAVEYWQKAPNGWFSTTMEGLASTVVLAHLQISVPLAELYDGIDTDA